MTTDASLFDFWANVPADAERHPADADVLRRLGVQSETGLLPNPFFGPLRTARIVLLYLSPGLKEKDYELSKRKDVQALAREQRSGEVPLPSREDYSLIWE